MASTLLLREWLVSGRFAERHAGVAVSDAAVSDRAMNSFSQPIAG